MCLGINGSIPPLMHQLAPSSQSTAEIGPTIPYHLLIPLFSATCAWRLSRFYDFCASSGGPRGDDGWLLLMQGVPGSRDTRTPDPRTYADTGKQESNETDIYDSGMRLITSGGLFRLNGMDDW